MALTDLQTFALAFAAVWGGLGFYLLHLHRAAARLAERLDALERR